MDSSEIIKSSNESYLRQVFNASGDAMILLDKSGVILDCNEQFCREVDKELSELIGIVIWDVTAKEDVENRKKKYFDAVVDSGEPCRVEVLGRCGWLDMSVQPIGTDKIVIYARDITNFKKAELLEKVNENRHKALAVLGQMYEADFEEILEYALDSALMQTSSFGGYIAEVHSDKTIFLKAVKVPCEHTEVIIGSVEMFAEDYKSIQELIITRKPVTFSTETSDLPSAEGLPVVIASYGALVPVLANGEVKLIVGVYGRDESYTEIDCIGLMHFMDGVWRLKERIDAEKTINQLNEQLEKKVALRTAQLRESEIRFRTAFESTANGMVIVSLDLEILQVNKAFANMTGYREDELVGVSITSITHPDDVSVSVDAVKGLLNGEEKRVDLIKRYIGKDGRIVITSVDLAVIKAEDDKPTYLVANILNITEVERTRKERDRIFELSTDIIVICDFKGYILYVNSAVEKVLGYKLDKLINKRFNRVLNRQDAKQAEQLFGRLVKEDEIVNFESMHTSKNNKAIWISWYFTVDRANNRAYGIGRDITRRKKNMKKKAENRKRTGGKKSRFGKE